MIRVMNQCEHVVTLIMKVSVQLWIDGYISGFNYIAQNVDTTKFIQNDVFIISLKKKTLSIAKH